MDTGDREEFLSLFTESAEWVSQMMGTFRGKDQIAQWFDDFWAQETVFHHGQHRVTNVITESVEPKRITLWSNWMFVSSKMDGPRPLVMGNYVDVVVLESDRWVFQSRVIEMVAAADASTTPSGVE